jgi:hypothetical protein
MGYDTLQGVRQLKYFEVTLDTPATHSNADRTDARSGRQLRLRDPQVFCFSRSWRVPHLHAPILQNNSVDTSRVSVHEAKLAPRDVK